MHYRAFGRSTLKIDSRLYLEASLQAIQMLKCSSKCLVLFRPVGQNGVPPGAQKHQILHFHASSDAFGCDSQKFRRAAAQKQIFRSARAPRGAMGPRSALCFYLLRGKVKQYYMFLFVVLASTFGAQRRNANLSFSAPLFALACCADIHAVIFWMQPT